MSVQKYRTNLNCGNCVAAVRSSLDELKADSWTVDLEHPDRILTVEGDIAPQAVLDALDEAGFEAQPVAQQA